MPELRPALVPADLREAVVGKRPETHDHSRAFDQSQLPSEIWQARVAFFWQWSIAWGRTPHAGSDVGAAEAQAVVDVLARRLVRVARAVERAVQPVPGAIAGEEAAGPIAPVRRRRQPEHPHTRVPIPHSCPTPTPP